MEKSDHNSNSLDPQNIINPETTLVSEHQLETRRLGILGILSSYSRSPLPPATELAKYNDIIENGAERLLNDFEKNAAHKRETEKWKTRADIFIKLLGQVFAFIFALAGLITTAYCAAIGQSWVAGIVGGTTIASVTGVFLIERIKETPIPGKPQLQKNPVKHPQNK